MRLAFLRAHPALGQLVDGAAAPEHVRALLRHDLPEGWVDSPDAWLVTALTKAVVANRPDLVRVLAGEHRARPDVQNHWGLSAHFYAAWLDGAHRGACPAAALVLDAARAAGLELTDAEAWALRRLRGIAEPEGVRLLSLCPAAPGHGPLPKGLPGSTLPVRLAEGVALHAWPQPVPDAATQDFGRRCHDALRAGPRWEEFLQALPLGPDCPVGPRDLPALARFAAASAAALGAPWRRALAEYLWVAVPEVSRQCNRLLAECGRHARLGKRNPRRERALVSGLKCWAPVIAELQALAGAAAVEQPPGASRAQLRYCYRGCPDLPDPEVVQVGRSLSWDGFLSASTDAGVALRGLGPPPAGDAPASGTLYVVCARGAARVGEFGPFPEDNEVVLPPRRPFRVVRLDALRDWGFVHPELVFSRPAELLHWPVEGALPQGQPHAPLGADEGGCALVVYLQECP